MELVATVESQGVLQDSWSTETRTLLPQSATMVTVTLFLVLTCTYHLLKMSDGWWGSPQFYNIQCWQPFSQCRSKEHAHQSWVHPDCGLLTKYQVQSEESGHYGEYSKYSDDVADIVNEQKPFIDESRGPFYWQLWLNTWSLRMTFPSLQRKVWSKAKLHL